MSSVRCLVAKVGLDGHDRGAHVIAQAFRDAGFEVIYSGLHNTADDVVDAAVEEDVDVIGLSILSGAHNSLVPKIVDGLQEHGVFEDVLFLVGGTIPDEDRDHLLEIGVDRIYGPGTDTSEAVDYIRTALEP
ncbi:MAG: cobalamin B12-binding domain-containing protein [bacterium]